MQCDPIHHPSRGNIIESCGNITESRGHTINRQASPVTLEGTPVTLEGTFVTLALKWPILRYIRQKQPCNGPGGVPCNARGDACNARGDALRGRLARGPAPDARRGADSHTPSVLALASVRTPPSAVATRPLQQLCAPGPSPVLAGPRRMSALSVPNACPRCPKYVNKRQHAHYAYTLARVA